jgi:PAS domain S-box-containing protein
MGGKLAESTMGSTAPQSELERQLRDMNEALLASSVHQHELTEKAEAALRIGEAELRQIADSMPQIVWRARPDGYIDYYNERWYEYTGFPRDQFGQSSWEPILHPDDVERCVTTYFACIHSGKPYQIEYRFKDRVNGGYRWFMGRALPIRNERGDIVRWFGTCTDIDDVKKAEQSNALLSKHLKAELAATQRAEAALESSELQYRRLFESAKDAILTLDARTGTITDANPFMQRLLGYTHAEFVGRELWELGVFEDKEAIRSAFNQLQREGYVRFENLPLQTKNGRKVDVEFVSNVYEVNGQPVAQCNIRDISERIRLEQKTQEQSEALADLHRRKDEFLAMLGHELRNPLAPISNALHLLRLQSDESPVQQQARTLIERQLTQLTRLVDDLLEVSRITTGRVHLRPERIVVSGIVERAVETVHPLFEQRMHELTVSVPPQPIWLLADAARLEQVLVNLLSNAAKYTEDGGRIWLTVEQEGDDCVVRVRDSGVGIAPELLPRIFDLFTQAERSLDRSEGGLGIGLALVHRLVEMHKGSVAVQSMLGRGSEFVVRLPVAPVPKTPSQALPSAAAESTAAALRILVVDDNVDSAESLGTLLQAVGHHVHLVHDGPTAVQAAMKFRPSVALLDIGLPRMNGYEVAKKMRQEADLANIVLVAMTGYGQESDRQNSLQAGFDHHLVKPADFGELQKILANVPRKPR